MIKQEVRDGYVYCRGVFSVVKVSVIRGLLHRFVLKQLLKTDLFYGFLCGYRPRVFTLSTTSINDVLFLTALNCNAQFMNQSGIP